MLLWSLLEPGRLPKRVAAELEDPENELWLSPMSVWETLVLAEEGRIELDTPRASEWIRKALSSIPVKEAPLNHEVAISSRDMTLSHQDPADRFIAATANVYNLVLVTADQRLLASDQIRCLRC